MLIMDNTLSNKKILLALTGSIAVYKAATLTRLLVKQGAEVRVLMTQSATDFITPLTLSTLSKHDVYHGIADDDSWNNHVELGIWADVMIVAPASANTLAKMSVGLVDNIVMACYLSAKCPVFFAPAMDLDMYKHASTQHNLELLQRRGDRMIKAEYGELASGLVGEGRMAEPENIVKELEHYFSISTVDTSYQGIKVLITAGPTHEHLDPVRFIGNNSSGKMGMAIAEEFCAMGAEVDLILGPSSVSTDMEGIRIHRVTSAQQMYESASQLHAQAYICVFAAAVADYRPAHYENEKIKKAKEEHMTISLEKNIDIAAELGSSKGPNQLHIGFALETNNEEQNARRKLTVKNFDLIVMNSLKDKGAGFGGDTNKITIYSHHNKPIEFELKSKQAVAEDIVRVISDLIEEKKK